MSLDGPSLIAFFLVFVRCSALLLSSPVFGAQTTPVHVRVLTTFAIAASLTVCVRPHMGLMPTELWSVGMAVAQEAAAGLLIGAFMTLALQVAQVAGGLMDLQVGLSSSQIMNPINGVNSTIIAQFKFMLGVVIFLCMDGHQLILTAMVQSYDTMPTLTMSSMPAIKDGILHLLTSVCLIAIQIAAPVIGVSMVIDTALGLINRAVPTFQAMQVGLAAKIAMGLVAVGVALPALSGGISAATGQAIKALEPLLSHHTQVKL